MSSTKALHSPPEASSPKIHWEAIVLAAGSGSRFGGGKLLAPYRGGRLIDGALRAALNAPVARVTVVTGHAHVDVSAYVKRHFLEQKASPALNIVHADDYAQGLSASLRTGINALSEAAAGVFVFLGDMPNVPADVPRRLSLAIGDCAAAAPVRGGVRGHPVLFKRRLFPALSTLSGDSGARCLIDGLGANLLGLESDSPGVLFDVDRLQDLAL